MIQFSLYDPGKYRSLKSLSAAGDDFEKRQAQEIIEEKFRLRIMPSLPTTIRTDVPPLSSELFVKHGVQNTLGMILLHRHFDLEDHEKLVESGNVSVPWSYTQNDDNLHGGSVVPRSWILADNGLHPYEFGYNSFGGTEAYPAPPENTKFYIEFAKLLVKYGLSDIVGLTLVKPIDPSTMRLEKTYRHANVVYELPAEAVDKDTVQAVWQFAEERRPDGYRAFFCAIGCVCARELLVN
jgi:hypothetical protein